MIWSVLNGEKKIYLTMFEANSKIDSGEIYIQSFFKLKGHELSDEIRSLQAKTTLHMIKKFLDNKKTLRSNKR